MCQEFAELYEFEKVSSYQCSPNSNPHIVEGGLYIGNPALLSAGCPSPIYGTQEKRPQFRRQWEPRSACVVGYGYLCCKCTKAHQWPCVILKIFQDIPGMNPVEEDGVVEGSNMEETGMERRWRDTEEKARANERWDWMKRRSDEKGKGAGLWQCGV